MTNTSELPELKWLRGRAAGHENAAERAKFERAAQAIERLKGERDNAIEQAAMECAVVEELDKTCKALRQQLADARAREGRYKDFHVEVMGALTDAGICTPIEGYLKPTSPRVGSDIKRLASMYQRELAEARVKIERKLVETNWGSIAKKLWPEYGPLGIKGRADRTREMVREALATPAPMDELQRLGQEYDAAPSTGEAERLKALGNAEQIAADRAANTTDPREAAVASRIANEIKQLRE